MAGSGGDVGNSGVRNALIAALRRAAVNGIDIADDDDPDVRGVVARVLTWAGHEVTMCQDGAELLDEVRCSHPDVVVTDHEMPRLSGPEARQALRESPNIADIPVVLATGSVTPQQAMAVLTDGDQLLMKPFQSAQLRGAVDTALQYASTRTDT